MIFDFQIFASEFCLLYFTLTFIIFISLINYVILIYSLFNSFIYIFL
jgi:hypothetical protein